MFGRFCSLFRSRPNKLKSWYPLQPSGACGATSTQRCHATGHRGWSWEGIHPQTTAVVVLANSELYGYNYGLSIYIYKNIRIDYILYICLCIWSYFGGYTLFTIYLYISWNIRVISMMTWLWPKKRFCQTFHQKRLGKGTGENPREFRPLKSAGWIPRWKGKLCVQALAMEKGIRMILVPAGMTGLLQSNMSYFAGVFLQNLKCLGFIESVFPGCWGMNCVFGTWIPDNMFLKGL